MERRTGRSSARARANASSPHGYQSTGLSACWRRYGLVSVASRFTRRSLRPHRCYFCRVVDPFITAAGPAPAKGREALLRQLALLGVAASTAGGGRASADLAGTFVALDDPTRAAAQATLAGDEPWGRWWAVLAAGQQTADKSFARALAKAVLAKPAGSPDGREITRRLADLADEVSALGVSVPGHEPDPARARFAIDGHRARPERRVLLVGRSSATYLVEPGWDALRLVRLAASEGPAAGNRAHLPVDEVVAAVRRGDAGSGRVVPSDLPAGLDPDEMLSVLREDPSVRDRRLIELAAEVREERERLAEDRVRLERERDRVLAEKSRLKRLRPPSAAVTATPPILPQNADEAAALLGIGPAASRAEVERSYRAEIARCHPDRVDGMHPEIQQRAVDLSVALNAARDLLLGRPRPARAARG